MQPRLFIISIILFAGACAPGSFRGRVWDETGPESARSVEDESKSLKITVFDAGQGDTTLIQAPNGETALIDAGPAGAGKDAVLPYLESEDIDTLTYIFVTHYHEDHLGGLAEVIAGDDGELGTGDDITSEGGFYDRGTPQIEPEGPAFDDYESIAAGERRAVSAGDQFDLGDCHLKVMAANGRVASGEQIDLGDPSDENAASLAILLEYGAFRMFLGADITGGGLKPPYTTPDIETPLSDLVGDIDVLRVAHHGSDSSSNAAFLDATTPEVAIISAGDGNDYFHPHKSVIERLIECGIQIYQTERGWNTLAGPVVRNGNIMIEVKEDGRFEVK